jgi:hypothetical protein
MVTRKHVVSAKKMIEKIRLAGLNNNYPLDKLKKYENRLNKWHREFKSDSKVIKTLQQDWFYECIFIYFYFY